mgnify:CR=1 FL=1
MSYLELLPAVDVKDGRAVRLVQGELSAEEKDQLRNLLSRNEIPATPTSTGV